MAAASPFQLKTFAIEPIVLLRRPHTSDGQQQQQSATHQSSRPDGRVSSIFKSPRLSLHKKESHGRKGTLVFSASPLKASKPQPHLDAAAALESVDFDPFEHSESFQILIQNPEVSAAQRCDLTNLRAFRLWLGDHFPRVVHTMRSLRLLLQARATASHEHQHHDDEQDGHVDSEDPSDSDPDDDDDDHDQQLNEATRSPARLATRALSLEAWQLLFRHAALQVFAPDDHVVTQDATRSGFVFFVLNGSCELRLQPKFLEFLLARRKTTTATAATTQQQSPHCEDRPSSPPRSPGNLKQKTRSHQSKKKKTADKPGTEARSPSHHTPGLRRLSLSHLTEQDAREVFDRGARLKTLRSGGFFGLDAALFEFPSHVVSVISQGALQRSDIGLTTKTCMHVLKLPFAVFQQIRAIVASRSPHSAPRLSLHSHQSSSLVFFPYVFNQERVEFLRQTFVFQSMRESTLQFLASHMRWLRIPRHEYLFTPGQQVTGVFLVKSGQLKVAKPYDVRSVSSSRVEEDASELRDGLTGHSHSEPRSKHKSKATVETRNVEREILQAHDAIGLHEVCLMRPHFASHCIAMNDDVELFALSSFALFAALACEPTASGHIVENLTRHHAWHKVREYAALNHHSSEKEAKLSLAVQQRGPIQCSRCGWAGHVSTSSICVRAESPKAMLARHASTVTSSCGGGGGAGKTAVVGAASPVVQLPLATRSSRTQQRLSSLVMAAKLVSEDAGELILNNADTINTMKPSLKAEPPALTSASPLQSVSKAPASKALLTHSNAIVHADSQLKASLLRGLLPFLCRKQLNGGGDGFSLTGCGGEANSTVGELERALKRLDDALVDEANQPIQPNDFTPLVRPQTEGGSTRRRAGGVGGAGVRGRSLNAAVVQAVGRMSTVAAATMEEAQGLREWPTPVSSSRSPRTRESYRSSSPKKPEPQNNQRAQRRNATNL